MSHSQRGMIAECVIAATLCAGVQVGIVEPAQQSAHRMAVHFETIRGVPSEDLPDLSDPREIELRALSDRLATLSTAMRDENKLFSAVTRLAGRHGLALEQVADARNSGAGQTGDGVRTYSISLQGEYAGVNRFVHDLESGMALVLVSEFEISAGRPEEPGSVQARLVVDVLDFTVAAGPIDGEGAGR